MSENFPIQDLSVPKSENQMIDILNAIDEARENSLNVYVHCLEDIGRTGTVIGCWLARQGYEGQAALKKLHSLWRQCALSSYRKSPEIKEQEEYILNWKEKQNQKIINRLALKDN